MVTEVTDPSAASVHLYWLPLGAGDNTGCVRINGRVYEALSAGLEHRDRRRLLHTALEVRFGDHRFVIEMAPVWSTDAPDRGVVCEGPVGLRRLGRCRLFRYEVRRWDQGVIDDAAEAIGGPCSLVTDPTRTQDLLALVPTFPTATWGRDELRGGEMWNSNSLTSWLLSRSGHDTASIAPPAGGRAPGWSAGLVVASRGLRKDDRCPGPEGPSTVVPRGVLSMSCS